MLGLVLGVALSPAASADAPEAAEPAAARDPHRSRRPRAFLIPDGVAPQPPPGPHDPSPYPGAFDEPPALHYRVRLPGPRLNAASHSEWSPPVLSGAWILVGSASGRALYALSRRDGSVIRTFPAEASVEAAATLRGDRVYFTDTGGNTYCYGIDGTRRWKHDGNAPLLVAPTVSDDGRLVVVTNVDDLAVALNADTGELVWQYRAKRDLTRQAELSLYAAPEALIVGNEALLGFSNGTLAAVDLETGEERWKRSVGEGRYPDLVADPLRRGTDVYTSGYYEPLVAIDLGSHNVRWRLDVGSASAPIVIGREGAPTALIHPGSDGRMRAVATLTGAELWTWNSGTTGALTSPVLTEAGLVVGSSEGAIYLVDPQTGDERWRWQEMYLLRGLSAEPAVEGRQLVFVTNAGFLYSMLAPNEPGITDRLTPW